MHNWAELGTERWAQGLGSAARILKIRVTPEEFIQKSWYPISRDIFFHGKKSMDLTTAFYEYSETPNLTLFFSFAIFLPYISNRTHGIINALWNTQKLYIHSGYGVYMHI